jgi:hypothetical protein
LLKPTTDAQHQICPQTGTKERADERTRTADLISLRVIIQVLQGLAQGCKSRISKRVSLLCLAPCCTVLRSRWCQSGVKYHPRIHLRLRVPSCWFYDLLRKALKSPNAILAVMQAVWQLQLNRRLLCTQTDRMVRSKHGAYRYSHHTPHLKGRFLA